MRRNNGFSLIELIVVMTIIMVVTVVAMVSFTGANQKARDNRRVSDLEKIRIALEIFKQQTGQYPTANGNPTSALGTGVLLPGYMQTIPTDPKSDRQYYYLGTSYSYQLFAAMEDTTTYSTTYGSGDCDTGAVVYSCRYQVTNP